MQELIPLTAGLLLGAVLGYVRPGMRLAVGAILSVVLGVLATIITGEFRVSWEYILFDIPLVAISAALGFLVARRIRHPAGARES
jgi:hypothetical protein